MNIWHCLLELIARTKFPRLVVCMLAPLIERFNKSSFYKSIAWVAGGTAAAQAVTIISAPVITRLYTPSDYGVLAVFVAILGIMRPLSTLTYSVTIPLAEDEDLAHNVLNLCFLITLTISFFLAAIILVLGDFIVAKFSVPQAAPYLWLLPVCLLGAGLYQALSSWAIRMKFFKTIARTKLSQSVSAAGIKIGLGWLGIQPLGLLLGLLASSMAGCGSITRKLIKEEPHVFRRISWRGMIYAAKRFSRFPLFRSWSRLLLALNGCLPVFFIAALFGVEVVGLFGLAHSMVNLPMNLIGSSVAQVYYAEIAGYGKSRPDKIRRLSISIMRRMLYVGIIPMGTIMIAGPWLFSFVFGAEWHDAGVYARLLSMIILVKFMSSPVASCLDVFEMQRTQLILNMVRMLLMVAVFMASKALGFSPLVTVAVYSFGLTFYSAVSIVFILFILKREARCI